MFDLNNYSTSTIGLPTSLVICPGKREAASCEIANQLLTLSMGAYCYML
ncbi:hypothetical protein SLEP1_g40018 [Rubroshorea leprosula]|uniref:Uncharacterized protein n=1 Tax=Rubroshorea leprosula TaxID=152421 RepID=A0AAV5L2C8_9ROSI|nr:hypothetical protein SLEP1_g40018 [Rubroshorea leprosula]